MEIIATKHFIKSAKPLAKKYRSFNKDYQNLLIELESNPDMGVDLEEVSEKSEWQFHQKGKGSRAEQELSLLI